MCLSVVCVPTFDSLDLETLFLSRRHIMKIFRSHSYIRAHWVKVKVTGTEKIVQA